MREWQEDAACAELAPQLEVPREEWTDNASDEERIKRSIWYYFYEGYESEPLLANLVDGICLSCPVIKECFKYGTETGQTGVHGGVYLNRGNIDAIRNAHKSEEEWAELMEKVQ